MIKKTILIIKFLFFVLLSGSSQTTKEVNACQENSLFKSKYFKCIANVEAYAVKRKNSDSVYVTQDLFVKSLKSIGTFCEVNWSLIANYFYNYTSLIAFLEQKSKWISWYEVNKCQNLKWSEN